MKHWDVVIVGAGPAGTAAAYDLAKQGLSTLILEKQAFPRLKPCAGGLTIKTLARLRFSISHLIHEQAAVLTVGDRQRHARDIYSEHPICVFTVRKELDDYCLTQARTQGAALQLIKGITKITETDRGVTVETACGEVFRCGYLIGADGAHSEVRKLTGAFSPDRTAVALEGLLPKANIPSSYQSQANKMTLDFGSQPLGYGWLFPKSDHVNVGLFTYLPSASKLSKKALNDYAMSRLGNSAFTAVHGYPIATGGERYQPASERVFLVGDAAGMAEALLGEGIHNAVATGQAAASAIISACLRGESAQQVFSSGIGKVQRDLRFSRRLAPLFYRCLPIAYQALIRYPTANVLMNGFAAGLTLRDCKNAFARFTTQFDRPQVASLD